MQSLLPGRVEVSSSEMAINNMWPRLNYFIIANREGRNSPESSLGNFPSADAIVRLQEDAWAVCNTQQHPLTLQKH